MLSVEGPDIYQARDVRETEATLLRENGAKAQGICRPSRGLGDGVRCRVVFSGPSLSWPPSPKGTVWKQRPPESAPGQRATQLRAFPGCVTCNRGRVASPLWARLPAPLDSDWDCGGRTAAARAQHVREGLGRGRTTVGLVSGVGSAWVWVPTLPRKCVEGSACHSRIFPARRSQVMTQMKI